MENIVFLETNSTGTGTQTMVRAKNLGYRVILITCETEFYASLEVDPCKVADEVIIANTFDCSAMLMECKRLAPKAVLAFDEYRIHSASIIAEALKLPGASQDGVLKAKYKHLCREALKPLPGIPLFEVITWGQPLTNEIGLKYPVVLKPSDDSGSLGVKLCYNLDQINEGLDFFRNNRLNKRGYQRSRYALIEEYIDGPEYSCELIYDHLSRSWKCIGFTKKLISDPPFFIELGHAFPVPPPDSSIALTQIKEWLRAIRLDTPAAHIEFRWKNNQAYLVEINPRMPGGGITDLIKACTGFDFVKSYLDFHLGLPVSTPDINNNQTKKIGFIDFRQPLAPAKQYQPTSNYDRGQSVTRMFTSEGSFNSFFNKISIGVE